MKRHNPSTIWPVPAAFENIYAHAVEIPATSKLLLVSGQIGVAPDGTVSSRFDEQCAQAMANVEALLAAAGLTTADLLRANYFVTSTEFLAPLTEIRRARWSNPAPPAVTTLVVAALARPDLLVEIEVTAGS